MAEKHSSPDWFARVVAVVGTVVGIVLSILSLRLGYSNSRWQKETQEETTAERILVHLDGSRIAKKFGTGILFGPKGEVGLEITNIGLRPLFIKRADMRIRGRTFTFYEYDSTEPMKPLGPSEAIRYRLSWDFEDTVFQKVLDSPTEDDVELGDLIEDIKVQVQTTKKTFSFQNQIAEIPFVFHQHRKSTSKQASPDH